MDINVPYNFMPPSNFNPDQVSELMLSDQNYEKNMSAKQIEEEAKSRLKQVQNRNIEMFWDEQLLEMKNTTTIQKSQHQLPLARIKRIMKSERNVKMISSDTPILFSKACELFMMELTLRSWMQTEENKRRTLHRCDIARAIRSNDLLDFLHDVVPLSHECYKDDEYARKNSQGNVSSSVESMNLPMINNLGSDIINSMIQEVPQQFMFDPLIMPSTEFHYHLPSK